MESSTFSLDKHLQALKPPVKELCSYERQYTELYYAIQSNDSDKVAQLCEENADVNQPSLPKCRTPLSEAASVGNREVVEILIKHRANPNMWCPMSDPPLICAAKKGHAEVVKVLLDSDAEVGLTPVEETSALGWAVHKHHTEVVRALLEARVNPNEKHFFKKTPLPLALSEQSKEIVELLLRFGASFDKLDHVKGVSVNFIVRENMLSTFRTLVNGKLKVEWEIERRDGSIWGNHNVLHTIYRSGRNEMRQYLLEQLPTLYSTLSRQHDMYGRCPVECSLDLQSDH